MKVKKLLLITLLGLVGWTTYAQDTKKAEKRERINALVKLEEENEPAFNKQNVFSIKLNSDGYGLAYESGKYITPRKTVLYIIELNEKYHPKEEKVTSDVDFAGNISQFKANKANNFYQLKFGYGQQRLIGGKANKNGVSVSAIYAGGLAIGILKPYYVDAEVVPGGENILYKFTDSIPSDKQYYVNGSAGFTKGWGEVKFKPGAHVKSALRFDYGRFNESVTAIEVGINLEYYPSEITQMAGYINNGGFAYKKNNMFFNAYIAIQFGKRK